MTKAIAKKKTSMTTKSPKTPKTAVQRSEIALKAVRARRRHLPGGSKKSLSSQQVRDTFAGDDTFSTKDIMNEFGAAVDNAIAVCATLTRQKAIKAVGKAKDRSTIWQWI